MSIGEEDRHFVAKELAKDADHKWAGMHVVEQRSFRLVAACETRDAAQNLAALLNKEAVGVDR